MSVLAQILSVAAMLVAADPLPLPPVTPWAVEYADTMCVLSRDFGGTSKAPVAAIALRPLPSSSTAEMVVIGRPAGNVRSGTVRLKLLPSGETEESRYVAREDALNRRVARFDVKSAFLASMGRAESMTITAEDAAPIHVSLAGADKAMAAVKPCQDDLLRQWGFDPALRAQVSAPAVALNGGVARWFEGNVYPFNDVEAERQGRTTIGWRIGEDGRPGECRLLATSGSRTLDSMACAVVIRRGRYKPARDAAGRAIGSYEIRRVNWAIY